MRKLVDLFKLIELTRAQAQYGYLLSGVKRDDLSNLAEHHYLVTFIGWQLAKNLISKGAKIDLLRVMEFCMIHDIGELMGGDISMHYAKVNPRARKFAKSFEEENQKFLSKFFGNEHVSFKKMAKEILNAKSDEALLAKVADYMEAAHFKVYVNAWKKSDLDLNLTNLLRFVSKIKDKTAKTELKRFIPEWFKELTTDSKSTIQILGYK